MKFTSPEVRRLLLASILLATVGAPAGAEDRYKSDKQMYHSSNGEFALVVPPRDTLGAGGSFMKAPRVRLYRVLSRHRKQRIAKFALVGAGAPDSALVSDDGRWVVTLHSGSSHSGGFTVVIYRSDGSVVRSLALGDLLNSEDLRALQSSVSRLTWSAESRLEAATARLLLGISSCGWTGECRDSPGRIEIDLNDGSQLGPKRQLLPHVVGRVSLPTAGPRAGLRMAQDSVCRPGMAETELSRSTLHPLDELLPIDSALEMPEYTELAWRTYIQGEVVLEVDFEQNGSVACVGVVKNLPFKLGEAARDVALHWRFRPAPLAGSTLVAVDFRLIVEAPPAPAAQAQE